MADSKKISFAVKDMVLGEDLSPSNLTLPILSEFIEQVATFLRGSGRPDLGEVKTNIRKGSLAVVAENPTGILDDTFKDYEWAQQNRSLERLGPVRARVIEQWQIAARNSEDRIYELFLGETKQDVSAVFTISNETDYKAKKEVWVDVEPYLYGKIYNLGGKSKPNVHIELENGRSIKIGTQAAQLTGDKENRLYKEQLVRKQEVQDSKTIKQSLKALEDEEGRYATTYGQGFMSGTIYEARIKDVQQRRKDLIGLQNRPQVDTTSKFRNMDLKHLSNEFKKLLDGLAYEDKLFTVRKIIDKVVATKQEVTLWGLIPITDTVTAGKVGLHANDSYCWST